MNSWQAAAPLNNRTHGSHDYATVMVSNLIQVNLQQLLNHTLETAALRTVYYGYSVLGS